jgi:Zn-finger nucleic acid-binding protein
MKCPVCQVSIEQARYEDVPIQVCPKCRGTLVEKARLHQIQRLRRYHWSEDELRQMSAHVVAADEDAKRRCPRCLMYMERVRVLWDSCVFHLDQCDACNVVWLDRGELELVQAGYEKDVDGRTPEDWARIERAAVADMTLKQNLDAEANAEAATAYSAARSMSQGPLGVAAFVAGRALRNVQQGMDEGSAPQRKSAFIRAGILLLVCVAILVLWHYLTAGRWWYW